MADEKLTPAARQDVIHAIQHGMLYDGRKRAHHWDSINAQIAAEKLADYLARANFVVMRGPPASAPSAGGTPGPVAPNDDLRRGPSAKLPDVADQ